VWDYASVGGRRVMLMESASGGDLEKGHTSPKKVRAKAMLEMFVAMHYLHTNGYAHADFKGEQVLLSKMSDRLGNRNLVAKLGDLGLTCQPTKQASTCKEFAGTPYYIAPELARAGGGRTYSNDMWSMGISLYMMMNYNKLPLFLQGYSASLKSLLGRLKTLRDSDMNFQKPTSHLDVLLQGLLKVNPKYRFDSEVALEKAQKWAEAEGVSKDEIRDIVLGSLDGKREQLSAGWGQCKQQKCYLGSQNRCEDATCVYPCHVSTSGAGPSCRTCAAPRARRAVNHCTSCNAGFEVVGTSCQQIRQDQKKVFAGVGRQVLGGQPKYQPYTQYNPYKY